jgi:hypothetical protein
LTLRELEAVVQVVVMTFSPPIGFTDTATVVVTFTRIPPGNRLELAQSHFLPACQRLAHQPHMAEPTRDAERAFQIYIKHLHRDAGPDVERELRQAAEEAGLHINLRVDWIPFVETMGA